MTHVPQVHTVTTASCIALLACPNQSIDNMECGGFSGTHS